MRVVTWNLSKRIEAIEGIGEALVQLRPDLVLLQAVTHPMLEKMRPAMLAMKLRWTLSSIDEARAAGKHAGNVVLSRWPCDRVTSGWAGRDAPVRSWVLRYNRLGVERPPWNGLAPRPWLLLRVRLQSPWGLVDVVNAHISLQARNRWDKVKTMDALANALEAAPPGLRLVGGDLASPRKETASGVRGYGAGNKDRGELWEEAELGLLGRAERHGLIDGFRALHPVQDAPDEASCLVEGSGLRRFDHLLVSRQFVVESAGYHREWMDCPQARGLSDHAPLEASFDVRLIPVGLGYSNPPPPLG
jgi:endonuclease/exonuclease/phosphatase family metal-dependent hydrolase